MDSFNKDKMTALDYELLKQKYSSEEILQILKKVDEDYPVQYAIGDVDFLGYSIDVDERVLIPRFETELLVKKLVSYIEEYQLKNPRIIDVCTGSGCIAISLASMILGAEVYAIDKSLDALDVAQHNAIKNGVDVNFYQKDVLVESYDISLIDVLVSNPPYVKLEEEVSPNTKYEPEMALYPGENDIIFYEKILSEARNIVSSKSIIAFEIGSTQGKRIDGLVHKYFPDATVKIEKDYGGLDRYIFIFNGFMNSK